MGESLEIRNRTCPKEYVAGRNDLDLNYLQETPIVFVFDFDLDKKNVSLKNLAKIKNNTVRTKL